MHTFYEHNRENSDLLVNTQNNHLFPSHFHINLEVLLLKKGTYKISVNDKTYSVSDGYIAVIDSYDIHSYDYREERADEESFVVLIPYAYLQKFNALRQNARIASPVICDPALCEELFAIAQRYAHTPPAVKEGAAALFLALLSQKIEYAEQRAKDESSLIRQLLTYIQTHFREDVTRGTLAATLGYAPSHISRVFHRYMQVGIAEYVNSLRLAYIDRLRADGDNRKMIELIYEAGFTSQQTYYRCRQQRENKYGIR